MKKLLASVLALGLVFAMSITVQAQGYTVNSTNIFGDANRVNNVNQGAGFGTTVNSTNIQGNGNLVNNLNLSQPQVVAPVAPLYPTAYPTAYPTVVNPYLPVYPSTTVNQTHIVGNGNAVNNINMQPGLVNPYMPYGTTANSTSIFGNFNAVNNINR